jgi:hypothetical protein
MHYRLAIAFALTLSAGADLPRVTSLRPSDPGTPPDKFSSNDNLPLFPSFRTADGQENSSNPVDSKKGTTLSETSKLSLIRFVSGEFAKARRTLPGGKDGFTFLVDKPLDEPYLEKAVLSHGAAVASGDNAQITRLEFHDKMIIVDVNGGGRPKKGNWKDHISFGMGGYGTPQSTAQTTATDENGGPPGFAQGRGGTIYLQFPANVPDLSPEDLKKILEPFLDFSKERSAAVHWIDTLPPEMRKAITDRRAALGMDREEVVAAIGKPDRKVRERDANGYDTEDWIYGHPPDKTVFVRFIGDKVTAIKQYPE